MTWETGSQATRCTEAVLNAFGIYGKVPHSGAGVLQALTAAGLRYSEVDGGGTLRAFCRRHPTGRYYLATANGQHGLALVDGHLTDYEGRGFDRRRLAYSYEVA